ncbi:MAG: hypothetical protein FJ288_19465 [Planctomycetes bacterium]|nr:hypothetical protein [Planctomycetota bacterium]
MNGLTTKVTVIKPGGESAEGEGRQIAPGRYEVEMPVDAVGTHVVRVVQSRGDELVFEATRGFAAPCKPEHLALGCNEPLLKKIAEITGGVYDPKPADVAALADGSSRVRIKVWPYLLAAACVLFVLDVALRRIDLGV